MYTLFESLIKLLKIREIVTDNVVFRLHYRETVCILIAFSILVTSKQYLGDPINCTAQRGIPNDLLETFCWVHSTFSINESWSKTVGNEIPYPGVDSYRRGDHKIHHAYYQWVCFVLFFQAILFYIPRYFWRCMESGKIKALVMDLNSPIMPEEKRSSKGDRLVEYFAVNLHHNEFYFLYYLISEAMNVINVIGQSFLIDRFLGGQFFTFGINVIEFNEWNSTLKYDPMIRIFPKVTKCTFHQYGSSGDVQKHDVMCILPINVINEKIYIFMWFWFVFLAVLSCCALAYRAVLIVSTEARAWSIASTAGPVNKKCLNIVLRKCKVGDWFLLHLLSKNLYSLNLKYLVENLSKHLEENKTFKVA